MLTFAIQKNDANTNLLECLRYAGIISINDSGRPEAETLITIKCPKKNSNEAKLWARKNAWHMFSLGINVFKIVQG